MGSILQIFGIEEIIWGRPLAPAMVILAIVGIVALSVFLYYRQKEIAFPVRISLAAARVVVLVLVLLVLLEPAGVIEKKRHVRHRLPILIDVSQSMSISDQRKRAEDMVEAAVALGLIEKTADADVNRLAMGLNAKQREKISQSSRVELAGSMISGAGKPLFDQLREDLDIDYYVFGTKLRILGDNKNLAANALSTLSAEDSGTSIADALEAVAGSGRDKVPAGILLFTDGLDTSSRRMESVLQDLALQDVPVYPVPMGLVDPDDVSIRNIVMQEVAFSGDKVPIRVQIQSKGYEKRSAVITVHLNGRSVARRNIRLTGGIQFEDIFFNVDLRKRGAAQVRIEVQPFTDEATAKNNIVEQSVRIVNEKINVLCIEGSPRWEYRYLRAMLKRDPRINVKFIASHSGSKIARASAEYLPRFPELREEAFKYDLVILGDVAADFFSGNEFLRLEELIRDRGGSLLMLCGSRHAPTSYGGTPLEKMLPVTFTPEGDWDEVADTVYPVLTPEGRSSLVMTLEMNPEENDTVWSRVAPLYRLPPFAEAKPGATVLATLSDGSTRSGRYPLVAWQRYGTGKCMVVGTDRMWLLRFKTGDKYHWRVWSQMIQFLTLSRLMGEHKRIRLETDRTTYAVDGQVQLYAHLLDERFEPVMQSGFDVNLVPVDIPEAKTQRVRLRPDTGKPGLYEGYFSPTRAGRYRVEANEGSSDLANTTEFQVSNVEPEMANTEVQMDALKRIAELTGGECLTLLELEKLKSLLKREKQEVSYTSQVPLWDSAWIILLLVALAGTEWIVRRRYDLP